MRNNIMSYDDTSFNGDMIVEEYDEQNNFMNPPSPTGYFFYHILGDAFDMMADMTSKFLNDLDILSADVSSLDKFWGVSYNQPRPKLPSQRLLTDEEYRAYLYLLNRRLLTREDIEIAMNAVFGLEDYNVYFTTESHFLQVSDYQNYTPKTDQTSNIGKNDNDETLHFVTDFDNDRTTEVIQSNLSVIEEIEEIINIPHQNWDSEFLSFLEQFISIKGNLRIKEYAL